MKYLKKDKARLYATLAMSAMLPQLAAAQTATKALIEEVMVTATKKGVVENVQDIPVAISAFGEDQIAALKMKDLSDIGFSVPNAIITPGGSFPGVALFSIRGMSPSSSIPSIDPSIGTSLDGVPLPSNTGVILDAFDLGSIEVLRGPQGVLFGRNVTGGAVLVNTKRPTEEFEAEFRARVDSGFRGTGEAVTYSGVITGPLTERVRGKLALYRSDDDGWFENQFNGDNYGKTDVFLARVGLEFDVTENVNLLVQYENGDQEGDGIASQQHDRPETSLDGLFSRDSHDLSLDFPTQYDPEWQQLTTTTTVDVNFGDGIITNILAWRDFETVFASDIDGTPVSSFHAIGGTEIEFWSNELRYNGTFGNHYITTGIYYQDYDLVYQESRTLLEDSRAPNPPVFRSGGGEQQAETLGVFFNTDYTVNEDWTVSAGIRYTTEEKDVVTAAQNLNPQFPTAPNHNGLCGPVIGPVDCLVDFEGGDEWSNVSYNLGVRYQMSETTMLYSSLSRSFRAGGYNVRRATFASGRDPFDEEQVDQWEIGIKADITDNVRLNVAGFYMKGQDMQRVAIVSTPDGVAQNIFNAAEVSHKGVEADVQIVLAENLVFSAAVGYLDAQYEEIDVDLNGDDVIDGRDKDLDVPFVTDFNSTASLTHDLALGDWGYLTSQLRYSRRNDRTNQDNTQVIPSQDLFDVNFSLVPSDANWEISIFGKNLKDEVNWANETGIFGTAVAPINKGRTYGIEFIYRTQ